MFSKEKTNLFSLKKHVVQFFCFVLFFVFILEKITQANQMTKTCFSHQKVKPQPNINQTKPNFCGNFSL